jgi:hypothetical protein
MPSLNIRNIGNELVKRLKSEAALSGKTLREYVIGKLEQGSGKVGVPGVPTHIEVPAPKGRKSASREPVGTKDFRMCRHGEKIGTWCGYCLKTVTEADCND